MLSELLHEPLASALTGPDICLERVRQVRESYRLLNRAQVGAAELLELKFACMYWRRELLVRLSEDSPPWLTTDDSTLGDIVAALNCRLPDESIVKLARRVGPKGAHYLLALQGERSANAPEYHSLAGPGVSLKIQANRNSSWPFERWKRKPEFSVYEFADGGIHFRGVHFLPGDVLLSNVNIDGNGVYTTLSDPTRFSSHAAVFAILEDGDKRYPAVIETYEKGVRAVPLNVFVGARFCAYVEVYRHKNLDASHGTSINNSAVNMMSRARGYNFDSRSDDRDYVSCCSVGRQLHLDVGLQPARGTSRIEDPSIRANLEKLEFTFFDFFAPVDYLLDDNFGCTGWVDNHQFKDLLARELVEAYFRELFMTRTLNPRRLPLMGHVNRWGIGHIRRRSLLGRVISAVEGFDHNSLPKGPDPLLAIITVVEAQLGRVVKQTRRWLDGVELPRGYFSLRDFSRQTAVRQHLESSLRPAWLE